MDDNTAIAEDLGDVIHLLLQRSFLIFGGGEHVGDLATCVFIPVPVTIARPVPCVTEVPLKIMLARSPALGFGECVRLLANRHGFAGQ